MTRTADIVSVFVYSLTSSRGECSCGWVSPERRRSRRAVVDALLHAADTGCHENWPLVYERQPTPARSATA